MTQARTTQGWGTGVSAHPQVGGQVFVVKLVIVVLPQEVAQVFAAELVKDDSSTVNEVGMLLTYSSDVLIVE